MTNPDLVHGISYASQPDFQFRCDGAWDTPAWKESHDLPAVLGIYRAEKTGRKYSWDEDLVDCPKCLLIWQQQNPKTY
jgi:hypothetical protein